MNKVLAAITMCLFCSVSTHLHAEGPWRLSLGVNYRQFQDVDLDAAVFQSPNANYTDYVNGATAGMPGGFVFVEDDNRQVTPAGIASLDTITMQSNSKGMDGGWGLALSAEKFWREGAGLAWNYNLSLTTTRADMDTRVHGSVNTDAFDVSGAPRQQPSGWSTNPNSAQYGPGAFASIAGGTASTMGYFDFDVDLDLYTIGAGISGNYYFEGLQLMAGAGPTLNIVDYEVSIDEVVQWTDGTLLYRRNRSDDTTKILLGLYLNLGVRYDFTERFGISAEYRYDHVFDKVKSTLTEVDLSGSSGQLKLSFLF